MSIDHNRIKIADLEKNQPNKILTTNTDGELEFSNINNISYNALDYTITGKALDARQGKVLKDLIENINDLLASDNIDLNTLQKLVDAIETVQNSLSTILVNDLTSGGTSKALTAEMGKTLKITKEETSNKKNIIAGNETSEAFYPSIKAIIDYLKSSFLTALSPKSTTLIDSDLILIGDSEDTFKTKSRTFAQLKATIKTYFDVFYQSVLVSGNNIRTIAGNSLLGSGDIPVQIIITASTSITTFTNDDSGKSQHGKNVVIDNGVNNINYTINGAITTSFLKHGTGTITFVQGSGRNMIQVDGTAFLNGKVGSTATISTIGTTDYLRISNAY